MLVHKGGKIKNWGGECRDVTPTNCSLKMGRGGRVGGVRMAVNEELKFKKNLFFWGGGGSGQGGSGWGSG